MVVGLDGCGTSRSPIQDSPSTITMLPRAWCPLLNVGAWLGLTAGWLSATKVPAVAWLV